MSSKISGFSESDFKRRRCYTLAFLIAALTISAAPPVTVDDHIRKGNEFFSKGKYEDALTWYGYVEERSKDPGLIAFNKGTAYFNLKDYRKAENHFRMALDDEAIPPARHARAIYNLGNCLVRQASESDAKMLREAIRCYEGCLDDKPDEELRNDAAYNLELAKMLWNKARAKSNPKATPNSEDPPDAHRPPESKKKDGTNKTKSDAKDPGKDPDKDSKAKTNDAPKKEVDGKGDEKKLAKLPSPGPSRVPVLPDRDQLERHSNADTLLILRATEDRLRKERQRNRMDRAIPERPSGNDW